MIDAVVYIGHGSRHKEGNTQFIRFIESVMKELPYEKQEIAFLEVTHPSIDETVEKLIKAGAKKILVVPILLFSAVHYKQDIPKELQAIQDRHPDVSFLTTEPFGAHPQMIQLVVKRIEIELSGPDGAILLVGRGSSDPEPIEKLREIGKSVEEKLGIPVHTAFLTGSAPTLDVALAQLQLQYKKIYVMPYLLFTGLLLKRIKQIISTSTHDIVLCHNLEFDDLMKQTCIKRIEEKYNESYLSNVNEVNW